MTERILLVDLENVQAVDLEALPHDVKVRFVLGSKQASLPTDLAIQAQSLGSRFSYVRISGIESNACDFCIAFYLGECLHANPEAECVILSKDKKGFDPLVKHLTQERDFNVRRVGSQKEAFAERPGSPLKTSFERVLALLKKEKVFPKKMKGLEGKVKNWCRDLDAAERSALVQRLIREGYVTESDKGLVFVAAKFRGA
jgi:PIN domain